MPLSWFVSSGASADMPGLLLEEPFQCENIRFLHLVWLFFWILNKISQTLEMFLDYFFFLIYIQVCFLSFGLSILLYVFLIFFVPIWLHTWPNLLWLDTSPSEGGFVWTPCSGSLRREPSSRTETLWTSPTLLSVARHLSHYEEKISAFRSSG